VLGRPREAVAHEVANAVSDKRCRDRGDFIATISMSWWLSQPIQAYLEARLTDDRNTSGLAALYEHLRNTAEAHDKIFGCRVRLADYAEIVPKARTNSAQ
jgi:hypothetical protein